jgi:hypothetical protein
MLGIISRSGGCNLPNTIGQPDSINQEVSAFSYIKNCVKIIKSRLFGGFLKTTLQQQHVIYICMGNYPVLCTNLTVCIQVPGRGVGWGGGAEG